jgi:hypothetical protein
MEIIKTTVDCFLEMAEDESAIRLRPTFKNSRCIRSSHLPIIQHAADLAG